MLDMKTAMFSYFITNVAITLIIMPMWRQNRNQIDGLTLMFINFVIQPVGILLILLRDIIPDFLSMTIGNTLLIAGLFIFYMGLESFVKKQTSQFHNYLFIIIFFCLTAYFTIKQPNVSIRAILLSIAVIFISIQCSYLMLYRVDLMLKPVTKNMGIISLFFVFLSIFRIIILFRQNFLIDNHFFSSPLLHVLFVFAYEMLDFSLLFSVILMINRRLVFELNGQKDTLQQTEMILKSIFNSIYDSIIITDTERRITMINPAVIRTFGYTFEELQGKTTHIIYANKLDYEIQGKIRYNLNSSESNKYEIEYQRKDGSTFYAETIGTQLKDFNGNVLGFMGINRDITERKQMEIKLRDSEETARVILNTPHDAILLLDKNYTIIDCNTETGRRFKTTRENMIGKNSVDVLPIHVFQNRKKIFDDVFKSGQFCEFVDIRDGRIIEQHVSPVLNEYGIVTKIVVIGRNITERIKMEKELQKQQAQLMQSSKMASLGEIATGLAHEINQPLTYISGFIQSTERDIKMNCLNTEILKDKLKQSYYQVNRIVEIIQHLRTFGRSDSLSVQNINIETVLNNTLLLMKERVRLNNINLIINIEPQLPNIPGNANRLEQVFINLFQNSIEAIRKDNSSAEIRVDISASHDDKAVIITFSDNGIGIGKYHLEKIFEPFFTTKEVGKGTGLGLSIVYGIIKEHHGTISCHSEKNIGTTLIIKLPIGDDIKKNDI